MTWNLVIFFLERPLFSQSCDDYQRVGVYDLSLSRVMMLIKRTCFALSVLYSLHFDDARSEMNRINANKHVYCHDAPRLFAINATFNAHIR